MLGLHTDVVMPTPYSLMTVLRRPDQWQESAVDAYRLAMRGEEEALRADLCTRVAVLSGRSVRREDVIVERARRRATLSLDGVVFQLQAGTLRLLRPCDACGTGLFASPPIVGQSDLGYALAVWEPSCPTCGPADDPDEDRTLSL